MASEDLLHSDIVALTGAVGEMRGELHASLTSLQTSVGELHQTVKEHLAEDNRRFADFDSWRSEERGKKQSRGRVRGWINGPLGGAMAAAVLGLLDRFVFNHHYH